MHYKFLFYIFFIFIYSCESRESKIIFKDENRNQKKILEVEKKIKIKKDEKKNNLKKLKIYNNKGFALIFDEKLFENKIVNKK